MSALGWIFCQTAFLLWHFNDKSRLAERLYDIGCRAYGRAAR